MILNLITLVQEYSKCFKSGPNLKHTLACSLTCIFEKIIFDISNC